MNASPDYSLGGGGVDKLLKSGQDLRASSLSMTHSLSAETFKCKLWGR